MTAHHPPRLFIRVFEVPLRGWRTRRRCNKGAVKQNEAMIEQQSTTKTKQEDPASPDEMNTGKPWPIKLPGPLIMIWALTDFHKEHGATARSQPAQINIYAKISLH